VVKKHFVPTVDGPDGKQLNKNSKYDILSFNHIHPILRKYTKDKVGFMAASHDKINTLMTVAFSVFLLLAFTLNGETQTASARMVDLCKEFNELNTRIRDGKISKPQAKEQFRALIEQIQNEYYAAGGKDYTTADWVFPLKGYGYKSIGGINGNGYKEAGYDYFDGNRHRGHPSQDIFIHDKKQQSIDDRTKKPVSVLSITGGVIVAAEKDWDPSSALRGGEYIWIYDPTSHALIYYAHNSVVHVEVGDFIKPGDVIAYVGRTGLNASKRRSPTHLHVTYLSISESLPIPRNIYKELIKSRIMD
jgi:murein DD-endopeptidase MepM/ murein hydrolase activator NlpD